MSADMSVNRDLMDIGRAALRLAAEQILKYYQTDVQVEWKADQTPVTVADKNSEAVVREFLARETPGFGFIGEEFGRSDPQAEYQWILDPIDGTKSFVRGVPLFGSVLGLWRRNEPIAGVIRLPALQSEVYAASGCGAFVDGRRARVSAVNSLAQATVLSGTLNTMEDRGYGEAFARLRRSAQLYRGWGDCYGYYLVLAGRAEVMVDPVVSIWDIAALPVLFREAGGRFSDFQGRDILLTADGDPVAGPEGFTGIGTNGLLHADALRLMHGDL